MENLTGPAWVDLTAAERIAAAEDLRAMVSRGQLSREAAMKILPRFARSQEARVVVAGLRTALAISLAVPPEQRPKYAEWVEKTFGVTAAAE